MKKLLSILLCTFVLIGVTGCISYTDDSSESTESTESTETTETNETNEKTSYGLNETAVYNDVHYTVTNVEYSNGTQYDKPADGMNYVIVTLKIENKSDSKISYNTYDWKMINSQGQEDDGAFTTVDNDTHLSSGDLIAGGTKTGTLVYEEPTNESSLKLLYYSSIFDDKSEFEIVIK